MVADNSLPVGRHDLAVLTSRLRTTQQYRRTGKTMPQLECINALYLSVYLLPADMPHKLSRNNTNLSPPANTHESSRRHKSHVSNRVSLLTFDLVYTAIYMHIGGVASTRVASMDVALSWSSRRSPVLCRHGCVACSQPLAAEAGLSILKRGGNAADAAVAVAAALNVTAPCSTGIGGDCFCLFYDAATKSVHGLNGR